ncbi:MAG: hypothetical protein WB341_01910 [Terracidiphilus sp.]
MHARSSVSSRKPFIVPMLKTVIAVVLAGMALRAGAAPTDTPAASEIPPWRPSGTDFYIGGPLRLNLGFFDQKGTPRVAEVSSLQPDQLAGLPGGVAQAKDNELFRTGHFDALWSAMKADARRRRWPRQP